MKSSLQVITQIIVPHIASIQWGHQFVPWTATTAAQSHLVTYIPSTKPTESETPFPHTQAENHWTIVFFFLNIT